VSCKRERVNIQYIHNDFHWQITQKKKTLKLFMNISTKKTVYNPIPIWLLLKCSGCIIFLYTCIVNRYNYAENMIDVENVESCLNSTIKYIEHKTAYGCLKSSCWHDNKCLYWWYLCFNFSLYWEDWVFMSVRKK
jgi:hypothetical protein